MLPMHKQITIKTLYGQGKKSNDIARDMGCHRNTVRNIRVKDPVEKQSRNKPSIFTLYREQIRDWQTKKVSLVRMHELLRETYGITRSYDGLRKYVKKECPRLPEAFGVQVTAPAEEAEVDFGYAGLQPVNLPGEPLVFKKTWVLAVTLAYSRAGYYQTVPDQKVSTMTSGINHAWEYFGGVPRRTKIDNLKAAILKNQHYDLEFNPEFLAWANHCRSVIVPCSPYSPQQKGKVESGVKYVVNNFFVERSFTDREDLTRKLYAWMDTYANVRVHGTTRHIPMDQLRSIERALLQPLPETPYVVSDRVNRIVGKNCHIFFGSNYYSVPAQLAGTTVTVVSSGGLMKIIAQGEEVACHAIASGRGHYVTQRIHLPAWKCYGQTEHQQKYEQKMAAIGEAAHRYFRDVLLAHDSYWFRSVRLILGLAHEYGSDAVNLSLKRALAFGVLDVSAIRRILTQKLYLLDLPPRCLSGVPDGVPPSVSPLVRDLSYYREVLAL